MTVSCDSWTDKPCWYVTAQEKGKTVLILGPFRCAPECRPWAHCSPIDSPVTPCKHCKVTEAMNKLDPQASFYAWSMMEHQNGYPVGILNNFVEGWDVRV